LGIDPGLASTGYGLIEIMDNENIHPIDYGVITTSNKKSQAERLRCIYDEITDIILKFKPDAAAIETIFYSRNLKSLTQVSEAIGVITLAAWDYGLQIKKYTPLEVKSAVVRSGKADKGQIQIMVKTLLNLNNVPKPNHAADALAIAICYNTHTSLAV
jgi:crossover junction endodeoxyribonuclease RuvC